MTKNILKFNQKMLENMPQTLDDMVGKGQWIFDKEENLYIIKNPNYKGPLFGFIAIRPDGTWFAGERPANA